MKRIMLLASIICLFTSILYAQITTNEQPIGLNQTQNVNVLRRGVLTQTLTAPNMAIINAEDAIADEQSQPLRFAYPIKVDYTLNNSGDWQILTNGEKLWRLKVQLEGALSSNAFYDKFYLPKGAKFFVYSEETGQSIGAITSEFLSSTFANPNEFATSLIYGETVVFEYWQPANTQDSAVISISRIDHGYRNINIANSVNSRSFGDANNCNININCSEGGNWQEEKRAIARALIRTAQGSGWCSCALVNNTNNDNTPYVLTANHCLGELDAISNNNASQWIFYWEYEHLGCNNSHIEPVNKSTTGAILIANNSISDFALLQLSQDPRNLSGFMPYYLGWDKTGRAEVGGIGIHHPRGDVKKISITNQIQNHSSQTTISGQVCAANTHWNVVWNTGTTEGGSSGSPLISNNHYIIGQLHGGSASCSNLNASDYYGKFNISWTGNGATDNRRKLQPWLDPTGINPFILSGKSLVSISGPDLIGSSCQATYRLSELPSNITNPQWRCDAGLTLASSSNASSATFQRAQSGSIPEFSTIYFSFYFGEVLHTISKRIRIRPTINHNVFSYETRNAVIFGVVGKRYYLEATPLSGVSSSHYIWTVTPPEYDGRLARSLSTMYEGWSTLNQPLYIPVRGTYEIALKVFDGCGWVQLESKNFQVESNSINYLLSPNPATNTLRVELNTTVATMQSQVQIVSQHSSSNITFYHAQLISIQTGAVMLEQAVRGDNFEFNVSGIPNGNYTLVLTQGNSVVWSSNVIVQH